MSKIMVVVGGQFGSEAKGHVAGYLAAQEDEIMAMRVAGPNAGHIVHRPKGPDTDEMEVLKFRSLPVALATNPNTIGVIAAGSEIDPHVLRDEWTWDPTFECRTWIDPEATWIKDHHRTTEANMGMRDRIGSTGKGIGAARADRIMRQADRIGAWIEAQQAGDFHVADTANLADNWLRHGHPLMIEAAQGFGLGLHAGYYPQCTSSDCRVIDALSMAGISPWAYGSHRLEPWVVVRPYPIRVAGNSGPLKGETSWDKLGLEQEYTTVTGLVRRVGTWDGDLVRRAIQANGGTWGPSRVRVALMMADYIDPDVAGSTDPDQVLGSTKIRAWLRDHLIDLGVEPSLFGTSPSTICDVRGL